MSDPTKRERIRAEAIERLARAEFEKDRELIVISNRPPWDEASEAERAEYRDIVAHLADALGDMLPVDEQWRVAQQISPRVKDCVAAFNRDDAHRYASRSGGTPERRYLGAWTEATE